MRRESQRALARVPIHDNGERRLPCEGTAIDLFDRHSASIDQQAPIAAAAQRVERLADRVWPLLQQAGGTGIGPLTFGHNGRMTEVRPSTLPLPSLAPLQRFYGAFEGDDFAHAQSVIKQQAH